MLDVQAEQLENVFQLIDCMTVPAHAVNQRTQSRENPKPHLSTQSAHEFEYPH